MNSKHRSPAAFGHEAGRNPRILQETISGGVTFEDTLVHRAEGLPFGGVGESGFLRFSHL